jgi:hypothetical protein
VKVTREVSVLVAGLVTAAASDPNSVHDESAGPTASSTETPTEIEDKTEDETGS